MYRISVPEEKDRYDLGELAKMFVPASEIEMRAEGAGAFQKSGGDLFLFVPPLEDKRARARLLYRFMSENTGKSLGWGTLTGVRPEKLYHRLREKSGKEGAEDFLKREYLVSEEKIALLRDVYEVQKRYTPKPLKDAVSIYIGIPFCPTRCLYCAFTSYRITPAASERYMKALLKEISAVASLLKEKGLGVETVYIGGGTPTSVSEDELEALLSAVRENFHTKALREFTVEAGRPDTITEKKLDIIKRNGAERISINPQSMKQETLDIIGRSHSPEEIRRAFFISKEKGFKHINADLIAGLPKESPQDFAKSLLEVISLEPTNITVHTLAVKRASRLIEEDENYAFERAEAAAESLKEGKKILADAGYIPYYMYRQKHMAGNSENVGYCKEGDIGLYNIRIMEEEQSVIALGAGGISKIYYKEEDRLERIPNVSNYEIYIEHIDEMIERKIKGMA